jgi:alpha,alpha-trehalase
MDTDNIFSLGELFEQVQMKNIFSDGKSFVDCTPSDNLSNIKSRYESEKNKPGFDLSDFVHENFTLPMQVSTVYKSDTERPVKEHLKMLWDVLTRQPKESHDSLINLPHPYIVPGGRFREIYYWDSYFTMLGLQFSGKVDIIQNMVDNFSFLVDTIGYIPNGNRTYYIGRSQPPFFACMVKLLSEEKGENILVEYLATMVKEYDFWMKGTNQLSVTTRAVSRVTLMPDGSILNHYWDENDTPRPESFKEDVELAWHAIDKKIMYRHLRAGAESGWDFSSRWFKKGNDFSTIHTTEIIPVDLNCLLHDLEITIAEGFQISGDAVSADKYRALADSRKKAILEYCWNDEKGFFTDYDYVVSRQKDSMTLAAVFPLFFNIASQIQAKKVAENIEKYFLKSGGLITTTETTDQQWDAPNGWAPLQWIAIKGLQNYGHYDLTKNIVKRWMQLNEKVYKNTGKMMEKYNVVSTDLLAGGGEYPAQDGFGWTNGVYQAMKELVGKG